MRDERLRRLLGSAVTGAVVHTNGAGNRRAETEPAVDLRRGALARELRGGAREDGEALRVVRVVLAVVAVDAGARWILTFGGCQ